MCAPKSNSYRFWQILFVIAEVLALVGCLYAAIGAICYRYYSGHGIPWATQHISIRIIQFGEPWLRPMFWSFVASVLLLLLVSPWFMWSAPLRRTALKAWIIGTLSFLCVAYCLSKF